MIDHDLILPVLFIITLVSCAFNDLRKREVPHWLMGALFVLALMHVTISITNGIMFLFLLVIAYVAYQINTWGGGDAKIFLSSSLFFGFPEVIGFLIILASMSVIAHLLFKHYEIKFSNGFPYVVLITVSFCISSLIFF